MQTINHDGVKLRILSPLRPVSALYHSSSIYGKTTYQCHPVIHDLRPADIFTCHGCVKTTKQESSCYGARTEVEARVFKKH